MRLTDQGRAKLTKKFSRQQFLNDGLKPGHTHEKIDKRHSQGMHPNVDMDDIDALLHAPSRAAGAPRSLK